jgi:hypothetical protein
VRRIPRKNALAERAEIAHLEVRCQRLAQCVPIFVRDRAIQRVDGCLPADPGGLARGEARLGLLERSGAVLGVEAHERAQLALGVDLEEVYAADLEVAAAACAAEYETVDRDTLAEGGDQARLDARSRLRAQVLHGADCQQGLASTPPPRASRIRGRTSPSRSASRRNSRTREAAAHRTPRRTSRRRKSPGRRRGSS